MSIELRVKWLLYILNKNQERGFDDIALIIVMFILGVLAVIFLPVLISSFMNQANKGKQAEAKQYVSSVNKAQMAYYTENNTFVTENTPAGWGSLAVGIKTQTANYKYSLSPIGEYGVNVFAIPLHSDIKGYTGVVGLVAPVAGADKTSQATVCEAKYAGEVPMPGIVDSSNGVQCPGNNFNPCGK